ncbi:MAG: M20/M25/M40 family metallo-hydrolase [Arenimonas sp.]
MKLASNALLASVLLLAATGPGQAQAQARATPHPAAHAGEQAALRASDDPFAPVYILTSRKTWLAGLQTIGRNPAARRDSLGTELVLARISAHQLTDVSEFVHENERRCGGYFAFDSIAQADAFLRSDRAYKALTTRFLASYTVDNQATVGPWLPQVSEPALRDTISHLSTTWPNRYYSSSHGAAAATWVRDTWLGLAKGRGDVSTELFTACGNCGVQPSVILTIQGTEFPSEIVVLGGHMDSISNIGSGETMKAPGADDDASGIASLTEVLRIAMASGWKPKRTVKFIGYAAEEPGLRGSAAIASAFKSQGLNVVGVLQLDMTNYRTGSPYDMQLITDFSNPALQQFLRDLFDTYLLPLGLARGTYTCGYGCSDHASWTSNGYPSAMMYEGGDWPYLHTPKDNLAQLGNTALPSVALAKLGLAFLGELGKTGTSVGAPVASFSFVSNGLGANFTDTSSDSNGSIASRSWNFGDGSTSTSTNPSHAYSLAGTYTVTLTVTDNSGLTAATSHPVTVTVGPGDNVLDNGVPVSGLAAATADSLQYTLVVPANASQLSFATAGGSGNADLYVKFGSAPTDSVYDCRPFKINNTESCNFAAPQAGTWYVRIKARKTFSGLTLTASFSVGGGGGVQTYANSTPIAIPDKATVDSPITVSGRSGNASASTQVSVNITHSRRGDLRIRLLAPDGSSYLLKPSSPSDNAPNVVANYSVNLSNELLNGTWKLRVIDTAAGNSGTINSWSITF